MPRMQRLNRAREMWGETPGYLVLVGSTIWAPEKSMDQLSWGARVWMLGIQPP